MTGRRLAAACAAALGLLLSLPATGHAGALESGIAQYRQGRLAAAEAAFRQAARAQPRSHQARQWLGVTLYAQRRYQEAAAVLATAAAMQPRDAHTWLWWGHALAQAADAARARQVLQHVLLLRPSRPVAELAQMGLRSLSAPGTAAAGRPLSGGSASLDPATYAQVARAFNPRLSAAEAHGIGEAIVAFGRQYNVDPRLIASLIAIESGFSPAARSHKGALGLGQLMPATAAALGVSAYDPVQNIYGTVRVMRGNLDRFGWDLNLALAAYNAGKGAVERYGGIPPYAETQLYVRSVGKLYLKMRDIYPAGAPGEGLASGTPGQGH